MQYSVLFSKCKSSEFEYFRDLKPENILLNDEMHIQITDFGSAKILKDTKGDEGELVLGRYPDIPVVCAVTIPTPLLSVQSLSRHPCCLCSHYPNTPVVCAVIIPTPLLSVQSLSQHPCCLCGRYPNTPVVCAITIPTPLLSVPSLSQHPCCLCRHYPNTPVVCGDIPL